MPRSPTAHADRDAPSVLGMAPSVPRQGRGGVLGQSFDSRRYFGSFDMRYDFPDFRLDGRSVLWRVGHFATRLSLHFIRARFQARTADLVLASGLTVTRLASTD